MRLMVSGEGPTDLGSLSVGVLEPGPMLLLLLRMVEAWVGYDPTLSAVDLIPKAKLLEEQGKLKPPQQTKPRRLPGAKTPKETAYYHDNELQRLS
jgi:hypothetical protein